MGEHPKTCSAQDISDNQREEFRTAFNMFDKDGDGAISFNELGVVMKSLGIKSNEAELRDMITEHDTDGSGQIEFEEFCHMMQKRIYEEDPVSQGEVYREAFRTFDKDDSGCISAEELRTVMDSLGESLSHDEIDQMIREADIDNDGEINYEEFVLMMCSKF